MGIYDQRNGGSPGSDHHSDCLWNGIFICDPHGTFDPGVARTMGADRNQTARLLLREMKNEIYFAVVSGYGRSISEVGAVLRGTNFEEGATAKERNGQIGGHQA